MSKATSARPEDGNLAREIEASLSSLQIAGFSDQSVRRLSDVIRRFLDYSLRSSLVGGLSDVDDALATAFIKAPPGGGDQPSVATMHLRRSALRLLFRLARDLSLATTDPTLDIELPPRSRRAVRPLTDDEILLCRSVVVSTSPETRLPAAWALGEATASSAELGVILPANIDLDERLVRLPGSWKVEARYGQPTSWGLQQLIRRLKAIRGREMRSLLYGGRRGGESRHAAGCIAISDTLRLAGLAKEPDVAPASLRAWAGVEVFRRTRSIDEVARRLGMRSLDRTAEFIGWDWRTDPA